MDMSFMLQEAEGMNQSPISPHNEGFLVHKTEVLPCGQLSVIHDLYLGPGGVTKESRYHPIAP